MGRGLGRLGMVVGAAAMLWLGASSADAGRILNRCGQSAGTGLWLSLIQQNGPCTGCIVKTAADDETRPLFRRIPVWTKRDITPENKAVKKVFAFVAGEFEAGVNVDRDQDLEFVAAPSGRCYLRAAAESGATSVVR